MTLDLYMYIRSWPTVDRPVCVSWSVEYIGYEWNQEILFRLRFVVQRLWINQIWEKANQVLFRVDINTLFNLINR